MLLSMLNLIPIDLGRTIFSANTYLLYIKVCIFFKEIYPMCKFSDKVII